MCVDRGGMGVERRRRWVQGVPWCGGIVGRERVKERGERRQWNKKGVEAGGREVEEY